MTEAQERLLSERILESAKQMAHIIAKERDSPEDEQALGQAVLMRALEMATPHLSAEGRARMFFVKE